MPRRLRVACPRLLRVRRQRGLDGRRSDFLAGRHRSRVPQGRGRKPLHRRLRPADARPHGDVGLRIQRAVPLDDRRRRRTARVYVGSGNEGQVYQIDADGRRRCSSTPKSSKCTPSRCVPGGGLYVGTSPDGKIYKLDATGKAPRSSTPRPYIWSLAVDRAGNVFAATGDKGDHLQDHARR